MMQTFIDTKNNQVWQFDDDVIVAQDGGVYTFTATHGERLNVPATLIPGELPAPPAPTPITRFSSLDYLGKFTDAEYTAVRSGPMALQRGLDSLIAAQFVDVSDPRTAAYLSGMVSAGIITEARKTALLTPQPTGVTP